MTTVIPVKRLEDFARAAYLELGVERGAADRAASLLVESDLVGQDGHGIFRLPQYAGAIRSGRIKANPDIRLVEEGPTTALVDGDNGLGHLVMVRATDVAIEKARSHGVAWVGVRGSNHAGAASIWASRMLPHDMIGIYLAVGSNNFIAPWGGFERLLGTNPIAFAVPALDEPPIVLDMATSIAANGKVQMARQRGEPIPAGWIIDRQGNPITDPTKAEQGSMLPIGEYKGYGLALMIALLAGSLNDAAVGRAANTTSGPTNTGQSVLAVSISRFGDPTAFKQRVDGFAREIRNSGRLPGVDAIRLPGERSYHTRLERTRSGVPIPPALKAALDKLAGEIGIAPLA